MVFFVKHITIPWDLVRDLASRTATSAPPPSWCSRTPVSSTHCPVYFTCSSLETKEPPFRTLSRQSNGRSSARVLVVARMCLFGRCFFRRRFSVRRNRFRDRRKDVRYPIYAPRPVSSVGSERTTFNRVVAGSIPARVTWIFFCAVRHKEDDVERVPYMGSVVVAPTRVVHAKKRRSVSRYRVCVAHWYSSMHPLLRRRPSHERIGAVR